MTPGGKPTPAKQLPQNVVVKVTSMGEMNVSKRDGKYIISISQANLKTYYGGDYYKVYEAALADGHIKMAEKNSHYKPGEFEKWIGQTFVVGCKGLMHVTMGAMKAAPVAVGMATAPVTTTVIIVGAIAYVVVTQGPKTVFRLSFQQKMRTGSIGLVKCLVVA